MYIKKVKSKLKTENLTKEKLCTLVYTVPYYWREKI